MDGAELSDAIGAQVIDAIPTDGFWCLELVDADGLHARIALTTHAKTVEIDLRSGNREIARGVLEGIDRLSWADDDGEAVLRAWSTMRHVTAKLELQVRPRIRLSWSVIQRSI